MKLENVFRKDYLNHIEDEDINLEIDKPGIYAVLSTSLNESAKFYETFINGENPKEISYVKSIECSTTINNVSWLLTNTRFNHDIFHALCHDFNLKFDQQVSKMSQGEQCIFTFCFTTAIKAKYYLYDEVFSHLDSVSIKKVKQTLNYLSEQGAIVFVTSNFLEELETSASHMIIIKEQKQISILSIEELSYMTLNEDVDGALGTKTLLRKDVYLHKSDRQTNEVNLRDYYEILFKQD